ncbi:MAG: dockerin type I repeat-containing protein, partial [Candidatus Glassbacteria bacterium]|nr:dockerin type I repeat-containing protein [Candidatus Glassbacteria bacterium]
KLNDGVSEPEVKLIISEDNGIAYNDTLNCSLSEDRFIAMLPAYPFETVLNYYFETLDAKGEIVCLPTDAPLSTYEIKILSRIPGDANNDDKINIFDLLELLKQLAGVGETNNYGDVNKDGKVNIFDLLELLKLIDSN